MIIMMMMIPKTFLTNLFIKGVNFVTNQILTDLSFNIFGFIIYGFYKYHTLHLSFCGFICVYGGIWAPSIPKKLALEKQVM